METISTSHTEISSLSNSAAAAAAARSKNVWAAPVALATNAFAAPKSPLKLTLSAYRRPENTVRLTDADPAQLIHEKYELLDPFLCRTLGHGASSTVRLAYRRSDGQPVAVKTIAKHDALGLWSKTNRWRRGARGSMGSMPSRDGAGQMSQQQVKRAPRLDEVDVLTSLRDACPNVVQLLDVYETHQEVQLVLEYCEGGDLFDCIKRRKQLERATESSEDPLIHGGFSELETSTVAKTLLDVLDTLHSRNIVHRDIKPENLLLVDEDAGGDTPLGQVKLTDFGLARLLHGDNERARSASESSSNASVASEDLPMRQRSRAYSRVGSDYYAAPEVHMGLGYDTPVDIYSLGVTLFVMLCGTPPASTSFFKSEDADLTDEDSICVASVTDESHSSLCSSSELFPSKLKISPLAQDLISKMIHPDPEQRITASEALKHEWIIKHSSDEDTRMVTRVTSKLSLSPSSDNLSRSRTLSPAETESFLRIGPALAVVPPRNSPAVKMTKAGPIGHTPEASRSTTPTLSLNAAISLTLEDVCNKLAPLVNEQRFQRKHRRSHPHIDKVRFRKRARISGGGDEQLKKKRAAISKKVCLEMAQHSHMSHNSCVNCRIGRRFNSGIPSMGPFLPKHPKSPA